MHIPLLYPYICSTSILVPENPISLDIPNYISPSESALAKLPLATVPCEQEARPSTPQDTPVAPEQPHLPISAHHPSSYWIPVYRKGGFLHRKGLCVLIFNCFLPQFRGFHASFHIQQVWDRYMNRSNSISNPGVAWGISISLGNGITSDDDSEQ